MFILQASPFWMEAGQNIECVKIFLEKDLVTKLALFKSLSLKVCNESEKLVFLVMSRVGRAATRVDENDNLQIRVARKKTKLQSFAH